MTNICGSFGTHWVAMAEGTQLSASDPRKMVLMTWRILMTALMKVWNTGGYWGNPVGCPFSGTAQNFIYRLSLSISGFTLRSINFGGLWVPGFEPHPNEIPVVTTQTWHDRTKDSLAKNPSVSCFGCWGVDFAWFLMILTLWCLTCFLLMVIQSDFSHTFWPFLSSLAEIFSVLGIVGQYLMGRFIWADFTPPTTLHCWFMNWQDGTLQRILPPK